ncbi:MAG: homoserine O-succinyltransferase [Planctomycetota bacterium]
MPLVAHSKLPTFSRLREEGQTVLDPSRANRQEIRELHIGLLNMMPDAALTATERQFFRLVGDSNQIAQFYLHPFTLPELERGDEARAYIEEHYRPIDDVKAEGLDALIVTGANVTQPDLAKEPFWKPLADVIEWASESVTSTLCSCLATHAVMQHRYRQHRRHLGSKCWGVFPHRVVDRRHPLVHGANTKFDVPHSRFNSIHREQFEAAGCHVLVEGEDSGVHLAVSEDRFRLVMFQGHPEYDTTSLLKEYKREVTLYADGQRPSHPPFPDHYLSARLRAVLEEYRERLDAAVEKGVAWPKFPEEFVETELDNTWRDSAGAVIDNWIGKVYQLTHPSRKKAFMDGVDPSDPLGLGGGSSA